MIFGYDLAQVRKAVIAVTSAAITVLVLFNVPVADQVPDQVLALFDAISAFLVFRIPNAR